MDTYVAPSASENGFHCPRCGTYAHQRWQTIRLIDASSGQVKPSDRYSAAECTRCTKLSVWEVDHMISPSTSSAPLPSPDMPDDPKADYEEARAILAASPRGACALLRLAVQKLCIALGETKDINVAIGNLVAKGLPSRVPEALDAVRVIGNESVHPGTLDVRDNPEVATGLFKAVNLIVERLITADKEIDGLFAVLPESKVAGIKQRDARNNAAKD